MARVAVKGDVRTYSPKSIRRSALMKGMTRNPLRSLVLAMAMVSGPGVVAAADHPGGPAPDPHAGHAAGQVHLPVSCTSGAQEEFDRALTLLHHMTYPQARAGFEA